MKTCTIHIEDEVHCRIGGLREEDVKVLWDAFGIYVDGYFHMPSYQLRRWDGKIRFFSQEGKTYTKLLDELLPYICSWGYDVNIEDKRLPATVINTSIDENVFGMEGFQLRPYQVEVVNAMVQAGSGFAICATGAGKTSMCAAMALILFTYGLQTIVIVPSSDLVTQTANEFREKLGAVYGDVLTIGEYSGDSKNIDCHVVIATWQSLQNAPHYMSYFQAVIVDEAHGAKAEVIKKLITENGKHIAHRYGVTGTMPKSKVDQYTLKCSIGTVVREVSAAWLIEHGYLSTIEIEPTVTQDVDPELPDYSAEKEYLSKHSGRLAGIAKDIEHHRDLYGNTMVLVNSITQGQLLQDLIPGSVFLYGGTGKDERQDNYSQYADQNGLIVIATFGIASTGISIDRIFCLYLVDAAKSFIRCIQSVGRGLRKKGDKNHVHVVDLHSKLKHSRKHFNDRKKYYSEASYPLISVRKLTYSGPADSGEVKKRRRSRKADDQHPLIN